MFIRTHRPQAWGRSARAAAVGGRQEPTSPRVSALPLLAHLRFRTCQRKGGNSKQSRVDRSPIYTGAPIVELGTGSSTQARDSGPPSRRWDVSKSRQAENTWANSSRRDCIASISCCASSNSPRCSTQYSISSSLDRHVRQSNKSEGALAVAAHRWYTRKLYMEVVSPSTMKSGIRPKEPTVSHTKSSPKRCRRS